MPENKKLYKVKHTSILHNGTVYGEGKEVELSEKQAERLAEFLEPIPEAKKSTSKETSKTKTEKSEKAEKTEKADKVKTVKTAEKTSTTDPAKTEGGEK
jgi:hypothetical protein